MPSCAATLANVRTAREIAAGATVMLQWNSSQMTWEPVGDVEGPVTILPPVATTPAAEPKGRQFNFEDDDATN